MKIIFATKNKGKITEMRAILKDLDIEIITALEAGISEEIIENGKTFEENALIKSRYVAQKANCWAIADDSGLCIEALGGAPGVHTARWAGTYTSPEKVHKKTIESLKGKESRRAWFESCIALVAPDELHWAFTGKIYGTIPETPSGISTLGLPYDSVFIPDGYNKTFAELGQEVKNRISHRGLAFQQLKEFLKEMSR